MDSRLLAWGSGGVSARRGAGPNSSLTLPDRGVPACARCSPSSASAPADSSGTASP